MESKLIYKKEGQYGVIEIVPETEAEYYAVKHWLEHARHCGLPNHMLNLKLPTRVLTEDTSPSKAKEQ